jgi:hypothetical protein
VLLTEVRPNRTGNRAIFGDIDIRVCIAWQVDSPLLDLKGETNTENGDMVDGLKPMAQRMLRMIRNRWENAP